MRSRSRVIRVVALVAIAAMGLAACGDDEDETETTTPATTARPQGAASVSVDMTEYNFAVSGPLTAGGTVRLANKGKEFHVAAMGRLKPGKTLADLQTLLSQAGPGGGGETTTTAAGGATTTTARSAGTTSTSVAGGESGGAGQEDPTAEVMDVIGPPGGFMGPGESAEITVPSLGAGTYAFICFVPSEGDGIPHFAKGMINQMEVVDGPAPAPPTADATYKVAPGKAIDGPATLSPGRHTLKIEAAPGSDQLEPTLVRLNPGATVSQLEQAVNNIFESEKPPPAGVASTVPGQILFAGLDLKSTTNFYLTVDLRAGNYSMDAEDTDAENRPRPPREVVNIKVA